MGPRLDGGDAVGGGFSDRGKGGGGSFADSGLNTILGGEDTAASRTEAAGRSGRAHSREVKGFGGPGFDSGGGEDTGAIEGERGLCSRAESSGGSDKATTAEKDKGVHAHKRQRCEKQSDFCGNSLEYLATTSSGHYPKLSTTFSPDNRRAVSTSSKAKYSSSVLKPSRTKAAGHSGPGFDSGGGEDTGAIEGARGGCSRVESSGGSDRATAVEKDKGVHAHKRQRCEEQSDFCGNSLEYLATTSSGHYPKLSTTFSPDNGRAVSTSSKAKYSSSVLKPIHSTSSTKRRLDFQYEDDGDVLRDSRSRAYSAMPYHYQFHDIFVSPHDLGIPLGTLAYYAANNRKIDLEIPAGDIRGQEFLSPTDDARVVIARSAGILEQLHEHDRSLAGHYDFTNFMVYRKKKVKLSDIKPGSIERLKKSNSDDDYSTFALELHKHFFINNLPSELKGWFCLLLEDPSSHEHLIANSISLMEGASAIYYFIYIYGELKALEQNCPSDYRDAVDYLNKRHSGWKARAKLNKFTKDVLEYRDPKTKKIAVYGDDACELLRLCRNLITHILGKKLSRQLYLRHKHILAIINSVFPGLLFDFQVAMNRTGARLVEFR